MENGFVIGGTNSGCGKTTITLAILAYLKREGFNLSSFKVGPDFIDPGHHSSITGKTSYNLDGWMLDKDYNKKLFEKRKGGISIVEGVMGLFDGYDGKTENGSTAQMSKWIDLPVILVVNAKSMARSAAALISGYENFDPDLKFAGVIFNNVGSKTHLKYLKDALEDKVKMPCLGGIPRNIDIEIPERHLGLVTSEDYFLNKDNINRLADLIGNNIDTSIFKKGIENSSAKESRNSEKKVRIGVAKDNAFCFYYKDNIEILEGFGAEIIYFSPVNDNELPQNLDGLYLGGGYPELHGKELSENSQMLKDVRSFSESGRPVYAECGGFMYLMNSLFYNDKEYKMTGCFNFSSKMLNKRKALGYREINIKNDTVLGKEIKARGHEFHYSEIVDGEDFTDFAYKISPRNGQNLKDEGYKVSNTLGSYVHLHFGSNIAVAENFVNCCKIHKNK